MNDDQSDLTIQCYVRTSVAAAPVDETIKTLRSYEEEGRVKRVLVDVWPDKVRVPEPTSHDRVLDVYRLFEEWADRQGVRLDPAFDRQTCTSQFTDNTWEEVITPVICVAVYREGELVGVYPHVDDGEVVTVGDALEHIEAGTVPTTASEDRSPSAETSPGACPACDGDLIDGQGLYTCPDCEWFGITTASGTYRRVDPPSRDRLVHHQGVPPNQAR